MSAVIFILVLAVLIFVHELGHFLVAKWNRVGVLEFAIGFGPVVWKRKYGETTYALRAIPLGGFVRMVGDDPRMRTEDSLTGFRVEDGKEEPEDQQPEYSEEDLKLLNDRSKWFIEKGYLAKMAVVLAGPGFNLIFALLLSVGYFFFMGKPADEVSDTAKIGDTIPGSPSDKAGMKAGDLVKSINGKAVYTWKEMSATIASSGGEELNVVVEREGGKGREPVTEELELTIKPVQQLAEELAVLENKPVVPSYKIGVRPYIPRIAVDGIGEALSLGTMQVYHMSDMIVRVMWGMVRGLISTRNIGGPISIFQATSASAERGTESLIILMVFLNVSLAIFNLLPIPILDGGHLVFFTIETLKGGPISIRFLERANQVGMFLLLLLMVFAFGNDISRLF